MFDRDKRRRFKHRTMDLVYRLFPIHGQIEHPIFIIGCGRSGTTILGRILEQHPRLAYLHEPRYIWLYEPRTDIWSKQARANGGRLMLTSSDITPTVAQKIHRAFAVEVCLQNARFLVEKLPINCFRLDFIYRLFPDALFIHLIRNGIEVAESIDRRCEVGRWFGYQDSKWRFLVEYARQRGEDSLVNLCQDNFSRGLLEWRLSLSTAIESLSKLPNDRHLEVRYEQLLESPSKVCNSLEHFIGVETSERMHEFALSNISRRSPPVTHQALNAHNALIAEDLLVSLGYLLK